MRILIISLFFGAFPVAAVAETRQCFEVLPGDERARTDDPESIKITRLKIGRSGQYAYIATQYLGAANLQAEVYLRVKDKYCSSGLLGEATDFRVLNSASPGYWPIVVESKSGSTHFERSFRYDPKVKLYKESSCRERLGIGKWVVCKE